MLSETQERFKMNIKEYKWSDQDIVPSSLTKNGDICIASSVYEVVINKQDAEAIAQHFNLIPEDPLLKHWGITPESIAKRHQDREDDPLRCGFVNNAPKYKHVIYSKGKADIYVNEELDEETRNEYFKVMKSRAKSLKRSMREVE